MPHPKRLLVAALTAALITLPSAGCGQARPADEAFGAKVRAYLLAHPEVLEEVLQKLEADKAARAAADAAAAIAKNRKALEEDERDFVANPKGRVTVVEFFDYKCPYCKTSADAVVRLIHDHPDVRFVFKEFPILSDTSSHAAADQLLARPRGRYLELFQALMNQPDLDDEKAAGLFKNLGLDVKALDTPEARAEVEKHIADNRALARAIGVDGTPAFIINGRRIDGWQPEEIDQALKAARGAGGL